MNRHGRCGPPTANLLGRHETAALEVGEEIAHGPRWFRKALENSPEQRNIQVVGCSIHLRCWGRPGRPGVVLVHGGGAHSGWWDHIAPFLATTHRVIAVDLSGHGDSGTRTQYALTTWASEVMGAAAVAEMSGPPALLGHSMGGWVSAAAGVLYPQQIAGVALIDTPMRDAAPDAIRRNDQRVRRYDAREAILSRFTTIPPQQVLLPYAARHVAEQSVRHTEHGWTWKFDPLVLDGSTFEGFYAEMPLRGLLARLACAVSYIRTEFGVVPVAMAAEIESIMHHHASMVELSNAGHHPMLDQPLALVAALRKLLEQWSVRDRSS